MSGPSDTLSEYERAQGLTDRAAPHLDLEIECERPRAGPARYRLAGKRKVRLGRGEDRLVRADDEGAIDVSIPDGWMSSRHAELSLGDSGWELVDLGSKNGTSKNGTRIRSTPVEDGDLLQLGHTFFRFRAALASSGPMFLDARDLRGGPLGLRTLSPEFAEVVASATALASSRVPVLLFGESGTGKELLAQAIHSLSGRSGAFVPVNCGAIPGELVESELFGHRKGAFSSAHADRIGFVRSSDAGTLFLDEIGDLPLSAQAALLRVLQESQVLPVGSDRAMKVDLRVVSATHRNLGKMVKDGQFRHDLLARLDGARLQMLPLRERRDDVPLLVATLLTKIAPDRPNLKLAPDAAQALLEYDWPLNIRELEHALEGALALASGRPIELRDLPRVVTDAPVEIKPGLLTPAQDQHRRDLVALLQQHRGNLAAVARAANKHRTQILRYLARYGLDADKFRQ